MGDQAVSLVELPTGIVNELHEAERIGKEQHRGGRLALGTLEHYTGRAYLQLDPGPVQRLDRGDVLACLGGDRAADGRPLTGAR